MKNRLFIIVAVILFTFFSGTGWAIGNRAVSSPVGSGTVPPTSFRSGLIRSPNPIDTSSNLVITGNVSGGKHFRGVVPYNAISDFGGRLGSTSLDSFLRRSAGSGNFGRYNWKPTPYYSPTGTVTATRPGRSGIFRSPTTKINSRAAGTSTLPVLPKRQALSSWDTAVSYRRFRPMSMSPQELEKLILDGAATYAEAKRLVDEQNLAQTERLQQDLKQLRHRAPQLRQSLTTRDDSLRPLSKFERSGDVLQPFELQRPKEQVSKDKQLDVYEQMKQQVDSFQKDFELSEAMRPAKETAEDQNEPGGKSSQTKKLSEADLSAVRIKSILGSHKTFASFSEDKFNQHMRAAEDYLKQGKYYRAADAYTLASIYKQDDPLAYAGKSHALFAAGEYMSSALFLSRALDIFPEYVRFKIDIEAMAGDRDKLESRIADVEQWLKRSNAAELQFLLGYVYYQMGRLERAKGVIDAAYEKMPESSAVIVLKKAIDDAMRIADKKN